MQPKSDINLVSEVQAGNKQAFNILVLRYQYRIYKVVARFIQNHTDAMDVTQETFIKVYNALPRFRGSSAFYTWVYRIAINTAKNHIATQDRRGCETHVTDMDLDYFLTSNSPKGHCTPERLLIRDEMHTELLNVINLLPDELKTTILLREMDGLSYEEIAYTMDCPVGTVRSRIFRAREAIDKKVQPFLQE